MNAAGGPMRDRILELLADRALQTLDGEEARELEQLLERFPELDDESMELAAASLHLTVPRLGDTLPGSLEAALATSAREFTASAEFRSRAGADAPIRLEPRPPARPAARPARGGSFQTLGWWAAAACLLLALAGWWPRLAGPEQAATIEPPPPEQPQVTPPTAPTLEDVLAAEDTLTLPWSGAGALEGSGVEGEVVWSTEQQAGFMRFRGLDANDPSQRQYQLWIFDREQDERYPIDGGVFDVPRGDGEVIIPIDPRLPVTEPTLFAVTLEKPGGVVVSSREELVLIAPAG